MRREDPAASAGRLPRLTDRIEASGLPTVTGRHVVQVASPGSYDPGMAQVGAAEPCAAADDRLRACAPIRPSKAIGPRYTDGMYWELWDTATGNHVGDYDSEDAALAVVRDALRRLGPSAIAPLALGPEHDDENRSDDELPPVLGGHELLTRAQQDPPEQAAEGP